MTLAWLAFCFCGFVSSDAWGHLPVVVLLEIWHSWLCRCHSWLVVCDVLVLEDKTLFCEDTYLVLCCWRFWTAVCALAWLACRFLKTRLCFVRTPTCCWLSCWWWFRTAVCVFVIFVWVGAGPVLVISAPGPRAPCNIFNPTRYTRLGIKCSSGLNSYARMPDNQQLKPLWRTAYYPHYRFIILLPTYYQSVCNGVISVGSDICLLFHCCS